MGSKENDGTAPSLRDRSRPFFDGRLTRTALMDLPTGLMLLSNVGNDPLTPTLEMVLGPKATREELWREMRKRRVDGRTFRGFVDAEGLRIEKEERLKASPGPRGIQ
jgi:hypothetical protein